MSGKGKELQPNKRLLRPGQRPSTVVGTPDSLIHLADIAPDQANIGDVPTFDGVGFAPAAPGAGTGTVTSVGLQLPKEFTFPITGNPITTADTFVVSWAVEGANTVFAGPTTGAAGTPGFRALVAADVPGTKVLDIGTATLSGGTVVVTSASTPAAGGVFLTPDGTLNAGALSISARTAGVSFTVSSLNILDARTFAWVIFG